MNRFSAMNELYGGRIAPPPYRARATIGCASLPLGARLETGPTAKERA